METRVHRPGEDPADLQQNEIQMSFQANPKYTYTMYICVDLGDVYLRTKHGYEKTVIEHFRFGVIFSVNWLQHSTPNPRLLSRV